MTTETPDPLAALFAAAVQEVEDKKQLKTSRQLLRKSLNPKTQETKDLREFIKTVETRREWTPSENVALFSIQTCQCGEETSIFTGLFMRQKSVTVSGVTRLIPSTQEEMGYLPKAICTSPSTVNICTACLLRLGYPLSDTAYSSAGEAAQAAFEESEESEESEDELDTFPDILDD